jgi:hypothetical protein
VFIINILGNLQVLEPPQIVSVSDQKCALYCNIFGKFMYDMVATHFNINFAVSYFSRYLQASTTNHLSAAKEVMAYLKRTVNVIFKYNRESKRKTLLLESYVDSDFTNSPNCHFTTGFVHFLRNSPIH